MKRRATLTVSTANRVGRSVDEDFDDIECHIIIVACTVKWFSPMPCYGTGSIREVFEKISNYCLCNSFITACSMKKFIVAQIMVIIIICQSMPIKQFAQAFLRKQLRLTMKKQISCQQRFS